MVLLDVNVLVYAHPRFWSSSRVSELPQRSHHSDQSYRLSDSYVADAFLAALAIESGSEWVTADRDYHRFPSLRVRHPFG